MFKYFLFLLCIGYICLTFGGQKTKMTKKGQKVRIVLVGNRYYSGEILDEQEHLIIILDKFKQEVSIGKGSIISMEVLN